MRLQGKTAVVTGGAGTIGAAAARKLVAEGARVMLVDRDAQAVAAAVDGLGTEDAFGLAADVTREADVQRYVEVTLDRFGAIDVFFNNAGIAGPVTPLTDLSAADFDAIMAVNVRGVFLGLKYVVPAMPDEASVIVTSSVAGLRGSPDIAGYCASKHAVMGLVRAAAMEFAPRRIRVNAINPGPVEGRMMRWLEQGRASGGDGSKSRDAIVRRMRLGRYIEADEVADLVVFLASDDSRIITGQPHVIDAGLTL